MKFRDLIASRQTMSKYRNSHRLYTSRSKTSRIITHKKQSSPVNETTTPPQSIFTRVWSDFKSRPFAYGRGVFSLFIVSFALYKLNSYRNRIAYMRDDSDTSKNRCKDTISVVKLDDKINEYKSNMIEGLEGEDASKLYKNKEMLLKKLKLRVDNLSNEQFLELRKIESLYQKNLAQLAKREQALNAIYPKIMCRYLFDGNVSVTEKEQLSDTSKAESLEKSNEKEAIPFQDSGLEDLGDKFSVLKKALLGNAVLSSAVHKVKLELELMFLLRVLTTLTETQRKQFLLSMPISSSATISLTKLIGTDNLPDSVKFSQLTAQEMQSLASAFAQRQLIDIFCAKNSRKVFVIAFNGDIMANQVANLREEVTAVIVAADASRGDEVVLMLNSGGGTVTGYGLAAAQLERLKLKGLKLTVCVDQVAASGGYMMASVGNKIVASPFAILGSIGVIKTTPNFSERLTREGISVDDITAGQYKRTLTPYKKPTAADRSKTQQDVNTIHELFKAFLRNQRPSLDLDQVATGEVWLAVDAMKKGLCDEISTSDDVILKYRAEGAEVFKIEHKIKQPKQFGLFSKENYTNVDYSYSFVDFVDSLIEGLANKIVKVALKNLAPSMSTESIQHPEYMSSQSNFDTYDISNINSDLSRNVHHNILVVDSSNSSGIKL